MQLFTRSRTIKFEHAQEAYGFSAETSEYVSGVTGLEVIPWTTVYGAPLGTVAFSARVDSQAAMGVAHEKLLVDPGYQERLAKAADLFEGQVEDRIAEFIGFAGSGGNAGEYAGIVTAQCAPGKIAEAMAWGVDTMNHVSKLTGLDVSLARPLYGPWATLVWISLAETLEQVDAADAAMSSDSAYIERIDQGAELFVTGSATQQLVRRVV